MKMQGLFRLGAVLALLTAPAGAQQTPSAIYGPLFSAVQEGRLFDDGKTFADAVPRRSPADIMADYRRRPPAGHDALRAFVLKNFTVRGVNGGPGLRQHIRALWPKLVRQPSPQAAAGGSALRLAHAYVVPGGRFQEIYYWDSYFTMLGLRLDGQAPLVEAMIDNFADLIDRHGHVPNGTRSYYLSRSQPPFFALMLGLSDRRDVAADARRLKALRAEHAWWMKGAACVEGQGACLRVVRMPDGSLLNRYWDDYDLPRDESWAEDVATAKAAPARPSARVWRALRAGAESGWDFSSRWLGDGRTLATIRTTAIVPVDLNSLMWTMERTIATRCAAAGDRACERSFATAAAARKTAIDRYLWQPAARYYADWDREAARPTASVNAAMLYPLFAGLSSRKQAQGVAAAVRRSLLAEGGLRTTTVKTGQQWDAPNGWAPLQWIAVEGLNRQGEKKLAADIARRWLGTVNAAYAETGKLLEKYNVEERAPGGGGEYPVQDGFGWTNGVASALLDRYPDALTPARGKAAR